MDVPAGTLPRRFNFSRIASTNRPQRCFVLMQDVSRYRWSRADRMHRYLLILLTLVLVSGCASHGWRRTAEGAGLGGGGAALAGEILAGPAGLAAGALTGTGAGAVIASKTQTTPARSHHYHNYVPVYGP